MYRITTILITILSAVELATAQIIITSDDILGLIGTVQIIESNESEYITVNVGSAGENQSWDFTNLTAADDGMLSFFTPAGTPFVGDFSEANFVMYYDLSKGDSTFQLYNYANINSDRFRNVGDGIIITVPNQFDTSFTDHSVDEMPLPLEYGLKWSATTNDTMDFAGFSMITIRTSDYHVDAWGTVTIAAGTYNCLRMREDYFEKTLYISGDTEFPADSSNGISYSWLSKGNFVICDIASMDGETDPSFTTASDFMRLKTNLTAIEDALTTAAVTEFQLEQNYPNPFNPLTVISYSLPEAGHINLSVYDSAGRHVLTLADGMQNAGQHSVQWNASGLSSGIYYYRLQSGNFSKINKAVLLK